MIQLYYAILLEGLLLGEPFDDGTFWDDGTGWI